VEHRTNPGDICILPRHRLHEFWSERRDPWVKIWFDINGSLVPDLLRNYQLSDPVIASGSNDHALFGQGIKLMARAGRNSRELQDRLALLVHRIVIEVANQRLSPDRPFAADVQSVKNYIDLHFRDKVTMEELAGQAHLSVVQMIRNFNRAIGTSPYDYLLGLRMYEAQNLLRSTTQAVKEIAFGVGFADEYYFSNFFKRKTGVSPLRFRQGKR
jgi:AraC-like DNA-binding protein